MEVDALAEATETEELRTLLRQWSALAEAAEAEELRALAEVTCRMKSACAQKQLLYRLRPRSDSQPGPRCRNTPPPSPLLSVSIVSPGDVACL